MSEEGLENTLLIQAIIALLGRMKLIADITKQVTSLEPHDQARLADAAREMLQQYTEEDRIRLLNENSPEDWNENPMLLLVLVESLEIEDIFLPPILQSSFYERPE